jgi:hypothetical protein
MLTSVENSSDVDEFYVMIGMLVRAWKKVSSVKLAKIWQLLKRTTRKWLSILLVMEITMEKVELVETNDRCIVKPTSPVL